MNIFAQDIDIFKNLGLDTLSTLNNNEVEYFNSKFQKEEYRFDFTNKKVGFFCGVTGNINRTKTDYFIEIKERILKGLDNQTDLLIVLNGIEKIKSGGFDAIVISAPKLITEKNKEEMLIQLKNRKN